MEPVAPKPAFDARLAHIEEQLAYLVERQKKTEELFAELTPMAREMMGVATTKLATLEDEGYFAFGREVVTLGQRIVTGFSPEDVRKLADAIVSILQTVRAVTQPKVLAIASDASEALERANEAEPIGLFGAMRATSDDDVKKGMGVMMEMMRHVGKAAAAIREGRTAAAAAAPADERKAKLAAVLGPRRKEPGPAPKTSERRPAPAPARAPAPAPVAIDGFAFGADGHLSDPSTWTTDLAVKIATRENVVLDEARWAVVKAARADFEKTGASPNIRRLTQEAKLSTKEVYALFPKAPGRTISKIAGIPKPVGCI